MGLAIVALIVLVVFGAVGGLLLSRVFASAVARNEQRPGGGGGAQERTGSVAAQEGGLAGMGPLVGGALSAVGVLSGLAGLVSAFWTFSLEGAVPAASVGILLGVVGYSLGARGLGRAAALVSAVALILGVAVSQGLIPGVGPTDHNLPQVEPRSKS